MPARSYVNLPPANLTFKDDYAEFCWSAAQLGFDGIRLGTDPTYWMNSFATGNLYEGIEAALDAAADNNLDVLIILEVHPNYGAASVQAVAGLWCTVDWPVLVRPPAAAWPSCRTAAQAFIDHVITYWTVTLGQPLSRLKWQWYNEPGTRGAGNCGEGDNDGWSGGYTDTYDIFETATNASSRQGIWDTSADWDTIETWAVGGLGRFANVDGFKELTEYMLTGVGALDFGTCELIAPAFEAQINGNWFSGGSRATNWELFDREIATYLAWALTLPFDIYDIHIYLGSAYTYANCYNNPDMMADQFIKLSALAIDRLKAEIPGIRVVATEYGVRPLWTFGTNENTGYRERMMGLYWRAMISAMTSTTGFEIVSFFDLHNRYASEEGASGANYGIIKRNMNWSAGAVGAAAGNGVVIDPTSAAPPAFGGPVRSWVTGTSEPAVSESAPALV